MDNSSYFQFDDDKTKYIFSIIIRKLVKWKHSPIYCIMDDVGLQYIAWTDVEKDPWCHAALSGEYKPAKLVSLFDEHLNDMAKGVITLLWFNWYIYTYIYIYWDLFSKKIWIISLSSWRESNLGVIPGDTIMIIPLYEVLWYYDIQMTAKAFPAVLQSSCKKKWLQLFINSPWSHTTHLHWRDHMATTPEL